jgi:[acyl-carrier-protein] S-malonyltransferase
MSRVDQGLAFVFPGQGSQTVGMLAELASLNSIVKATFAEASEVLGYDLWQLVSEGPSETLNATRQTQPAMLAAGVAAWRFWNDTSDVIPGFMAGHSLGEYTALVCAGSLDFKAGIRLVAERARLMQEAVPEGVGAMAAILGLEDEKLIAACAEATTADALVIPANFNAPGQVVIAGHATAVAKAGELAKAAGAKRVVTLPVSVPSHCPLMKQAATEFRELLNATDFAAPSIRVLHNVDVEAHADAEAIRTALEHQLFGSVRWTETIRVMAGQGVDRFIECGPGSVLAGLNKRIVPDARTQGFSDSQTLDKAKELAA